MRLSHQIAPPACKKGSDDPICRTVKRMGAQATMDAWSAIKKQPLARGKAVVADADEPAGCGSLYGCCGDGLTAKRDRAGSNCLENSPTSSAHTAASARGAVDLDGPFGA